MDLQKTMADYLLSKRIRRKKLGALIKDARINAGKTTEECANIMQVAESRYCDFESGVISPSLPELELFAYQLNTPLDHFWGSTSLSEQTDSDDDKDYARLLRIRQRIIGAKIKQARYEANLTSEDLSNQVNITDDHLGSYEMGDSPIPLPELELILKTINKPIREFYDDQGPIGEWETQTRTQIYLSELPTELTDFITKPVNRPYLELAQRLSDMSSEKIRAIAEALLEITL